jgi:hypothetical protein
MNLEFNLQLTEVDSLKAFKTSGFILINKLLSLSISSSRFLIYSFTHSPN